jgi:tetratricopeptide (TPR) repeat protein
VSPTHLSETQEALISESVDQLLAISNESARHVFLVQNPHLLQQSVVLYLTSQVPKIVREDVDHALRMAELSSWLAEMLNDDYCRARSARAMGHPLQLKGKLRESLSEYQKALDFFTRLKLNSEIGITLSGSLQPLILLGNYEEARLREEKAREIFRAQGDELRLARLDANLGNLLHRQDRFEEALVLYRRAEQSLQRLDDTHDLAIVLNNLAVCLISLRDFPTALETYRRLRTYSEERELRSLTVQADYNIAYMHYLQGEHDRAVELYQKTRTLCARTGDPYHAALCDLDQAEIYLHLNLYEECAQFAKESLVQFQRLKMNYEAAKAYTFLGLAACHQTDSGDALDLFVKARDLFVLEQNSIWLALLDLYRAIVLYRDGGWAEALKSVVAAQNVLSHSALKDKAALADLLRSLLHLERGESEAARYWGELALERIEVSKISDIKYLGEFVLGRVRESQSDPNASQQYYLRAQTSLECGTSRSQRTLARVSFLKDTDTFYQHLISGALSLPNPALTHKLRLS